MSRPRYESSVVPRGTGTTSPSAHLRSTNLLQLTEEMGSSVPDAGGWAARNTSSVSCSSGSRKPRLKVNARPATSCCSTTLADTQSTAATRASATNLTPSLELVTISGPRPENRRPWASARFVHFGRRPKCLLTRLSGSQPDDTRPQHAYDGSAVRLAATMSQNALPQSCSIRSVSRASSRVCTSIRSTDSSRNAMRSALVQLVLATSTDRSISGSSLAATTRVVT